MEGKITKSGGLEAGLKRAVAGLSPWIPLFAFVAAFQAMRGAIFDAIYFSLVVGLLVVELKGWSPFELPRKPNPGFSVIALACAFLIPALLFLERNNPIEVAILIALLLIGISLVWYRDGGVQPSKTKAMNLSKWLWITLAVLISLWELFAFILSDVASDSYAYPTISILMVPFMASELGKLVFLLIWFAVGIFLLRVRRK